MGGLGTCPQKNFSWPRPLEHWKMPFWNMGYKLLIFSMISVLRGKTDPLARRRTMLTLPFAVLVLQSMLVTKSHTIAPKERQSTFGVCTKSHTWQGSFISLLPCIEIELLFYLRGGVIYEGHCPHYLASCAKRPLLNPKVPFLHNFVPHFSMQDEFQNNVCNKIFLWRRLEALFHNSPLSMEQNLLL